MKYTVKLPITIDGTLHKPGTVIERPRKDAYVKLGLRFGQLELADEQPGKEAAGDKAQGGAAGQTGVRAELMSKSRNELMRIVAALRVEGKPVETPANPSKDQLADAIMDATGYSRKAETTGNAPAAPEPPKEPAPPTTQAGA